MKRSPDYGDFRIGTGLAIVGGLLLLATIVANFGLVATLFLIGTAIVLVSLGANVLYRRVKEERRQRRLAKLAKTATWVEPLLRTPKTR